MHKLGTGIITSTQDVDRLEFDWGKIHFLSEPTVTGAIRFSFGSLNSLQEKVTSDIIIPDRRRSFMSYLVKENRWWTTNLL